MQRDHGQPIDVSTDLPLFCAIVNDGKNALIKRGEMGYRPMPDEFNINAFNRAYRATAAQIEAMVCGSMFGFDVPGADPKKCPGTSEAKDWV